MALVTISGCVAWWVVQWPKEFGNTRVLGFPFAFFVLYYATRMEWQGYRRKVLGPPTSDQVVINFLKARRFRLYLSLMGMVLLVGLAADFGVLSYIWPRLDCLRVHTFGECEIFFKVKSLF